MRTPAARIRMMLHAFGWRGLTRRMAYLALLRSGALRRQLRVADNFDDSRPVAWRHRFDLDSLRYSYAELPDRDDLQQRILADSDRVLAGELQLYGWAWKDVAWPPRWHRNPFTAAEYPRKHWTEISDDDPGRGDIKDVWELSRLPFTFLFTRAYVLTGDERYPEAWWVAVEDWADQNPPHTGVNWRCGQETSLRGIALCFGLSVFADHRSSTPDRLGLVERILGASLERVRPTLGYALSQRNNHAISELVFLLSVRPGNERKLLRLLLEVLDDQFYPDGSYSQQSFTYQRLAVQALQWLLLMRTDLPPGVRSRVIEVLARSRDFLARCSDPVSGWLPNYGPNDGALLFPLSAAHYRDFRPLLANLGQHASEAEHHEPEIWLPMPDVASRDTSASSEPSTYRTMCGPRSLLLTRIGTGRHRPAHDDQQAVDIWIDGRNIVLDPGTYRYTAPAPWRNALAGAEVHSLPRASGEREGLSAGRFLSEGMPAAEVVHIDVHANFEVLVSKRPALDGWLWRALVRHGDVFTVVDVADDIESVVRWNLGDLRGAEVTLVPAMEIEHLDPGQDDPISGWASSLYGCRERVDVRRLHLPIGRMATSHVIRCGESVPSIDDLRRALAGTLPSFAFEMASPDPS